MRAFSSRPSQHHWASPYVIGGICGLGGGVLIAVGVILSLPAPFLVGIIALGVCESALVVLLARISRAAAGCALLVLGAGVLAGAVGITDLLLAPGYVAIGFICWIAVAPVAAVMAGRAGLLALAPASSLLVLSVVWLSLSATGLPQDHPIVQAVFGAYFLSWAFIGFALLRRGLSTDSTASLVTFADTE